MGMSMLDMAGHSIVIGTFLLVMWQSCIWAFDIRLYAITNYGRVIHEFDPWFNYRATEYLGQNGWTEFFHWYDYKSWYPLGRPVGTTIYPGMQISSVVIWKICNWLGLGATLTGCHTKHDCPHGLEPHKPFVDGAELSLNDVSVYTPVWFGVSGTIFLALLTGECTKSWSSAAAAAAIMAVVPAHLMRCHGGGYDNESVAITTMCGTFFLWCRALRTDPKLTNGEATRDSYIFGVLAGFMYVYMVAAWGGARAAAFPAAILYPLFSVLLTNQ
eukprot:SAG11_NODE_2702_length_3076_cov_2.881088_3_plen_272_part_00